MARLCSRLPLPDFALFLLRFCSSAAESGWRGELLSDLEELSASTVSVMPRQPILRESAPREGPVSMRNVHSASVIVLSADGSCSQTQRSCQSPWCHSRPGSPPSAGLHPRNCPVSINMPALYRSHLIMLPFTRGTAAQAECQIAFSLSKRHAKLLRQGSNNST